MLEHYSIQVNKKRRELRHFFSTENCSISFSMKQRFRFLLEKSPKTLVQIAKEAGYTVDYIHRLKRETAKERFNEDTIEAFSRALDIYPSELLPLEWQKPNDPHNIDTEILATAISKLIDKKNASLEEKSALIAIYYESLLEEKQIKDKNITQTATNN